MKIKFSDGKIKLKNEISDLSMLFAGDLCPRGKSGELILEGKSSQILREIISQVKNCNTAALNLEAPLTNSETAIDKSGPPLKLNPDCVKILKDGGWQIVSCANNHIGDYGPDAVKETLRHLDASGIKHFGAGVDLETASKAEFFTVNKKKIAFIGITENEFGTASASKAGSNPLRILKNIAKIKETAELADITIVMYHGGNEYNPLPSPRVVELCRAFADAGASAVIAGHTHCPQGIEIYHEIPIVYSLGNFLFDSQAEYSGYNWNYGYMSKLGFSGNSVAEIEIIPINYSQSENYIRLLAGTELDEFMKYMEYISEIILSEEEIKAYFDAWCMRGIKGYFSALGKEFYPTDWKSRDSIQQLMGMRNIFTCEAHCELITNTLRILEERRENKSSDYLKNLEVLCQGKTPES